ncbi:MFS transporter [Cognatishimia maritima]|uniref:Fucose permease n=1 Tax=Cognatishimia maritima TaxID=870908 RepID=A0A1M5JE72_9RHOB|nr:MFS transporter [Cognatishimia maritima]SHG38872.1 Fucose permease [Cognatishimia maritima]
MVQFLAGAWALLLGILLLMLGNGMHGTLLGVRGEIEGFSTTEMSYVMSAYFVGFLGGSKLTPEMIRRVGHVRVFAALASFISACLILFPVVSNPWAWVAIRVVIGFCFSGVYVTAEGWLNNAASNETRGQALSFYMIVQMLGIIAAQGLLLLGDPSGFALFVIPSVLVSISFAPILLSVVPTPAFDQSKSMSFRNLWSLSPLGFVGIFLLGGMFAAQFGMAAVFGTEVGMSVREISMFVAAFYVGALVTQFPIGWLSDRMDRRVLIMLVSCASVFGGFAGSIYIENFTALLVSAFVLGGTVNPLYSLLLAHTHDFVEHDEMAGTSGSLLFVNGLGAIIGPIAIGWLMNRFGAVAYFGYMTALMAVLAAYAAYRMVKRPAKSIEDTSSFAALSPTSSPIALEVAQIAADESMESDNER